MKDKLEAIEGVQFKQFNSITDYHSLMFDLGVVARGGGGGGRPPPPPPPREGITRLLPAPSLPGGNGV
ncbi:hypothetical protein AB9D89_02645 [Enterobacter cloacae]